MNQHKILIKPILIKYINKMKNENILSLKIDNKNKHLEKYLRSQWSWKTYVFILSLISILALTIVDLEINFLKYLLHQTFHRLDFHKL